MTNPATEPDFDAWEATMRSLRDKFPQASDGILFCIHKLQQNPILSIKDFRDEARLHGIGLSGRSLHSAKVLLGMEKPAARRRRKDEATVPNHQRRASTSDVEDTLIAAVQKIQESATADSERLRAAIRAAISMLQRALDGRNA